ncbi:hypothetical protein GCM10027347_21230 [Larkinella harenae]
MILGACSVQDHLAPVPLSNPYENCLLSQVREVEKRKLLPGEDVKIGDNFLSSEYVKVSDIVEIDGERYALASSNENSYWYNYDAKKRLVEQTQSKPLVRGLEKNTYNYTPGQLSVKFVHEGWPSETREYTYTLDQHGFIPKTGVVYDSEGYVVENEYGQKITISGGNAVKSEGTGSVATSDFDVTKMNIPNPTPFISKTDRNLLMKTVIVNNNGNTVGLTEYRYTFDGQGKVTRRIRISRFERTFIDITEYVYSCQ